MRNRCTFFSCYSGLLCHESMFLGELSDMVGIKHHKKKDPHSICVVVKVFIANMCVCLEAVDPNELSIKRCLPGVNLRFDAAQHEARQMRTEIGSLKEEIVQVKGMVRQIAMRNDMVDGLEVLLDRLKEGSNEQGKRKSRRWQQKEKSD